MNISRAFILRPVATSLLMAAAFMAGLVALRYLPVAALPEVDYPTIEVRTFYPGASPEVMTSAITAPLEGQLGQMPGLTQMSSTSSAGASVVTLQFSLDLSLDIAEQEVQAAINAAGNLLPSDLPAPPIYAKINPADAPILSLAVTSKTLSLSEVADLADSRLAQKISQLPGVGFVSIGGGQRLAIRVQANPLSLAAHGLNLDDLRTTIASANVNTPKGSFEGASRAYAINANDQLKSAEEYKDVVVAYKNGSPVRLSDVAKVVEGPENTTLSASVNNIPAVILNVQRQPGANVVAVVDGIRALLPVLQNSLPPTVDLSIITDRTTIIRASVADVELELVLSIALVVLVIFVFLRDVSATIIPSLSVPLSVVGAFCAMHLLGFSLNTLTLMALTVATGFVVDDAIVMIENIARHIDQGETPLDAALKGSRQIGFTIVSLTISLIAVLIPLLFMDDVIGRLFREFSITLAATILISAVVSLTLTPMLCAKLLRRRSTKFPVDPARNSWFDRLTMAYNRLLVVVLDHPRSTLFAAAATLCLTVVLYVVIPKGFFPVQDTSLIRGVSVADPTVSYDAMARRQAELAATLLEDPDVRSVSSFIGIDGTNMTLNSGRLMIALAQREERSADMEEMIRRLGRKSTGVAGIKLYLQPVQDLSIDTLVSRTQYQFTLVDADPAELGVWTKKLADRLASSPELADVVENAGGLGLSAYINIDRDAAVRFGVTPATIDNALYDAFGQRIVSTIFTQGGQYRVILEADPKLQESVDLLSMLHLPTANGGQAPLSAMAKLTERTAPLQIDHLGQFPASTISFNLAPGHSLGAGVAAIEQAEAELGVPVGVITTFQGAALAFQSSLSNERFLVLAAIVTVYVVLGVLYESFIHPLTILSTLPSAGVGALLALMAAKSDLGVIGVIGVILLIGIVKKNAIMMIDFALEAEREGGKSPRDAIHQACLLRLRPILMTTMAALLGALPLALGSGPGSELRHPLGVSIVGGLIVSQVLTLFTTPVIYLGFNSLACRLRLRPKGAERSAGEGET